MLFNPFMKSVISVMSKMNVISVYVAVTFCSGYLAGSVLHQQGLDL